ncbi:MAG TPA: NAD-dependent epimerase/dehydratase family protein [Sedimentisphaerales bacterium]|nr:NAD-dependent epimerase/dehydratase family protein [Sedimentisphaerales bacterium]
MPVLVTGATGLLGSHLVDLLLERGESVRALVRPGEAVDQLVHAGVDIRWGDLSDRASLQAAVAGVDRVLHCAARTGPWGPRSEYEITNIRGLETLINAALDAGVRRFVHVSSITVLGNDMRGAADEASPLRVEPNPYSWSKVMGERLLDQAMRERQVPVTIVRPGWIYGPRDTASFARFAAMIQRGRMILIGSGNNRVPLIYVRDVAEGIVLASEAAGAVGRVYLLVNDEPVTQRDYLNAIAAELSVRPPSLRIPYRLALTLGIAAETLGHLTRMQQPPPLTRYGLQLLGGENRFAIGRARAELGFSPQINLAEGVRRSVTWYRTLYCPNGKETLQ